MTKTDFLLDALEYYCEDPNRRSIDAGQKCCYPPAHKNTEGCAIGRHLSEGDAIYLEDCYVGTIIDIFNKMKEGIIENVLPEWMSKMNVVFLQSVQNLHDKQQYWDLKSLSLEGKTHHNDIIRNNDLDKELFKQFL